MSVEGRAMEGEGECGGGGILENGYGEYWKGTSISYDKKIRLLVHSEESLAYI